MTVARIERFRRILCKIPGGEHASFVGPVLILDAWIFSQKRCNRDFELL